MSALLIPFGYPNSKLAGTEIAGNGIDPISGVVVAPNSVVSTPAAATATIAAAAAAKQPLFPYSRNVAGR